MTLSRCLGRLVAYLDEAEVPFMMAGSLASSFYGINRTTQDMDLVIDPTPDSLRKLVARLLTASFYVSEANAMSALSRRTQFNVIDMETSWKADLVLCKQRPFSAMEFSRRTRQTVLGVPLWLCSPEDSILSKLEWSKSTGSLRQLEDVKGLLAVRRATLDLGYLRHWAAEIAVEELLLSLLEPSHA